MRGRDCGIGEYRECDRLPHALPDHREEHPGIAVGDQHQRLISLHVRQLPDDRCDDAWPERRAVFADSQQ